jgi:hypothetical protein
VPTQNLLRVAPQQPVDDVCWLDLVNADQLSLPPNCEASWEPPDETLNSRGHPRSGQTVRRTQMTTKGYAVRGRVLRDRDNGAWTSPSC